MITSDIIYIGVEDRKIDLFEGQYPVPNGITYNSYAIIDEKIAIMDTVDALFAEQWLQNVKNALCGRSPDYLVVHHMEPDHSANIANFMNTYPETKLVSSAKAFAMIKNFFGNDFSDRRIIVGEGDTLSLGKHNLSFITAPMVHWPEVVLSYDSTDKVLFSADAFGKFGTLDTNEDWIDQARRYYIGIVGKYGAQVQSLLKKAASLDIRTICPLHGPVLKENLGYYLDLYNTWSSYQVEKEGVVIAYTSVYGNTKKAVLSLKECLIADGCENVLLYDLARCDMSQAVAAAFCYSKLVLATTTYNADVFPFMKEFIHHLKERNFSNRIVAFVENGSWAPMAAKIMKQELQTCKSITFTQNGVKILSALNSDSLDQIKLLSHELCNMTSYAEQKDEESSVKGFVCKVCGYVHKSDDLPADFVCPLCKQGADKFEPVL